MKVYRPTTNTNRALLLEFGVSKSDTLLAGWDGGDFNNHKNIRIYRRTGNSNTSITNNTNPSYNNGEWVDLIVRFENGTFSLTIGGTTVSTSLTTLSRIGLYNNVSTSRLSELKIKPLYWLIFTFFILLVPLVLHLIIEKQ